MNRSIVVVGATGKTGRHCVRHALATGGACAALARPESAAKLEALAAELGDAATRLTTHPVDLTDPQTYGRVFDATRADSVILNVPSMPGADRHWSTKVMRAVLEAIESRPSVRKVVVTAGIAPTGLREGERYGLVLRVLLPVFRMLLRARFADMDEAFTLLRGQERAYTIVRAEELSDDPGTGEIHAGLAGHLPSNRLTRDDFGLFCVQATAPGFHDRDEPAICTVGGR